MEYMNKLLYMFVADCMKLYELYELYEIQSCQIKYNRTKRNGQFF